MRKQSGASTAIWQTCIHVRGHRIIIWPAAAMRMLPVLLMRSHMWAAHTPCAALSTAMNTSRPLGMALNGSAWIPGACGPRPSALGYQCSWVTPRGAVLHWTFSTGSSAPPINRCTAQPQAVPNLEIQEFDAPTVHFALQAASKVCRAVLMTVPSAAGPAVTDQHGVC